MRLDKYLCDAGFGTRSEVKKLLRSGAVTVDGEKNTKPETKITESHVIAVAGEEIRLSPVEYWMLYKPAGYISATEDRKLPTVLELLPESARSDLFPVGRLDRDTEGLLLLTNDGKLAHFLLSPKRHVDKTYYARIDGQVTPAHIEQFQEGLDIGDEKKTLPAKLEILTSGPDSEIKVTLREGRYHQVKRMFEAIGCEVTYLKRLSMGSLLLDEGLRVGGCRLLTQEELLRLKEETGC